MARAILVIGEPGTGKSRAIKGLDPKETIIIKPNSKELPFRGAGKNYVAGRNMFVVPLLKAKVNKDGKVTTHGVDSLLDEINKLKHIKNVVIEDLTHYFSKRVIDERTIKGYDKWTELAAHTKLCIIDKESSLRPDLNLIVIGHVTAVQDASGQTSINIQTPGKLMDNSIKIPSYFTYIFHTFVDVDDAGNTRYRFLTNKDGVREAKSPEECFPKYIENDYKTVIDGIAAYQLDEGITPIGTPLKEEVKHAAIPAKEVAPPKDEKPVQDEPVKEEQTEATTGQEVAQ